VKHSLASLLLLLLLLLLEMYCRCLLLLYHIEQLLMISSSLYSLHLMCSLLMHI